jgi:hypothetical protein
LFSCVCACLCGFVLSLQLPILWLSLNTLVVLYIVPAICALKEPRTANRLPFSFASSIPLACLQVFELSFANHFFVAVPSM